MYQMQSAYEQPPHQHGRSQGHRGPPPAKKPRSNPVITRYPPPPGYQGLSQQWTPYGSQEWQNVAQPAGYSQQSQTPGTYQSPLWQPGYQAQSYPQPGYPPSQGYFPPNATYQAPQQPWPVPTSASPTPSFESWQPPSSIAAKRRHSSTPYPNSRQQSIGPVDGNVDPLPPQYASSATDEDVEDDFDGECYFARHPEEINPDLSLGLIEWHPPLPTNLPPPATFAEAELETVAPRKPRPDHEESVSDYYAKDRREEALLSIRRTATWEEVKNDLIYREFPAICEHIVSFCDLYRNWRNRPDPDWLTSRPRYSLTPSPAPSREQTPAETRPSGHGLGITQDMDAPVQPVTSETLNNLQRTFSSQGSRKGHSRHGSASGRHSRATSVSSSQAGEKITRPKPLAPLRDERQEDILAALGVTGSAQFVYQTPGPAIRAPSSARSREGSAVPSRPGSVASMHSLPTVEEHNEDERDRSKVGQYGDLEMENTPRPVKNNGRVFSGPRKRSHGELEGGGGAKFEEEEDATPKPKSKQQRF
ncbi:hypothetical protein KC357_g2726 [Hortaea werneckii]|nr:hypothetical protein KC357_g2726 [Hortaea werneckii]